MNQSDTQVRASTFDLPILIASAISALVFIYLLARSNNFINESKENVAGILRESSNVVRIRPIQDWAWIEGGAGSNLHSGDLIFTYNNSNAKIDFSWGGELYLAPNTLIKIEPQQTSSQNRKITLRQGQIEANLTPGDEKLQLNYQGQTMSLEAATSAKTRVQFKAEGEFGKLYILDGEARVKGHQNLTKGKILSLAKDGSSKVEQLPFIYDQPVHKSFHPSSKATLLSWKMINETSQPLILKIATDEGMKQIIIKQELIERSYSFRPPHDGTFYWRLATVDGTKGAILQFSTAELSAPNISLISEQKNLVDGNQVLLSIQNSPGPKKIFHWEWLRPDGNSEFHDQTNPIITLPHVQAGRHEIRVRNEFLDHFSEWSEINFEIAPPTPAGIPTIIYPREGQLEYFFSDQKNTSGTVMAVQLEDLGEGVGYQISLQNTDTGSSELITSMTPSLAITPKGFGTFLLKVRSQKQQSSQSFSQWSHETKFIIREIPRPTSAPEHGTKIELEKPSEKVTFSWQAAPIEAAATVSYLFELDDSPDFDSPSVSTVVTDTTFSNAVDRPGIYYWRIKIQTSSGQILYSKPHKVQISPTQPPVAPEIKDLKLKIKWKDSTTRASSLLEKIFSFLICDSAMAAAPHVELEWPAIKSAKLYHVQIFDDSKNTLLFETKTQKTNLSWIPPNVGTFYWRMAIVDWWDRLGPFSELAQLDITYDEEDTVIPTPQTPDSEVTAKNDGPLLFVWSNPYQGPLQLIFQLASGNDEKKFQDPIFQAEANGKSVIVPMNKLRPAKKYYWRLALYSKQGKMVTSSEVKSFKIAEAKQEILKPVKITMEAKPAAIQQPPRYNLQVSYGPTLLQMDSTKNSSQTQIDGTAFGNFRLDFADRSANYLYATPDLNTSLLYERGVVFGGQTYSRFFLSAQSYYETKFIPVFIGPYLGFGQLGQFENKNGTVVNSSATLALVGLALKKQFESILLKFEIAFGLGMQLNTQLVYSLPESLGELASHLRVGIDFEKLVVEANGIKTDYQAIRPFAQYSYSFK